MEHSTVTGEGNSIRNRVYNVLEAPTLKYKWHGLNIFLMVLIGLNVIAMCLETVSSIGSRWQTEFLLINVFSVIVFTIEYLARIWACVEMPRFRNMPPGKVRLRYMCTPMALIDLIAILPFYLSFFVSIDLRAIRSLRLLRVLKFTRYADSLDFFKAIIMSEIVTIISGLTVFCVVVIIAATGVYFFENSVQPEAFSSIPEGMWWAIATVTTVGYGDVVPLTIAGKMFGALVMLIGVAMIGLTSGLVASAVGAEVKQRRNVFKSHLKNVLIDGEIDERDKKELGVLREHLRISERDVRHLTQQAIFEQRLGVDEQKTSNYCPHCGEKL